MPRTKFPLKVRIYPEDCGMSIKEKQALPLEVKLKITQYKIKEWYRYWGGNVFISNSGGRDSSVLAHIVMDIYPEVSNIFLNTGLEFPEILNHVKTFPNLIKLQPKKKFLQVINEYGYPVISKETSQKIFELRNTKSEKLKRKRLSGPHSIPKKWRFLIRAPFKISDRCCYIMKKTPSKKYEKEFKQKPYIGLMLFDEKIPIKKI
ncbi:hypothetical protein LCGC14_1013110 [marine sediment metagenome]|uniref:Phosphoadenosine phosphosulphate reductase domain-containing protein n=1 Tax=marine sediment metagenome TaxID=412755 RepID=A0A0F9NL77_9ZZZZ